MEEAIIPLRVREIIVEKYNVKTFVFERPDGQAIPYKAGQFLTFLIELNGREVRRSYSMSSAPDIDPYPAITVKRVANGEVSRLWIDHVQVGDMFQSLPPSGRFVLEDESNSSHDIVLIGAGSGITPLLSLLKEALFHKPLTNITLIYANRNEKETLFMTEISALKEQFPDRLKIQHIHSQPDDEWNGMRGRINNTRLERFVFDALKFDRRLARFFICGPFDLMRSLEITLHYLGFKSDQIRKENFVISKIPPPPIISNPHTISLEFGGEKFPLLVPAHTTVLDAALQNGIKLPYSCRGGRCATCAVVKKAGALHMTFNEVLTDRDLANGWILTCCAYVDDDKVELAVL